MQHSNVTLNNYNTIPEDTYNNSESILLNGRVVNRNGNVVGYVDVNSKIHHTLPQTGENEDENIATAV